VINATPLGEAAAEQMTEIEKDYSGRDGELGVLLSFAQVIPKDGGEPEMRLRSNVPQSIVTQILREMVKQTG
jgi:hypothetical protein